MGIKRRSAPAAVDYLDEDDDTVTTLRSRRKKDDDDVRPQRSATVEDEDEEEDEEDEEPPRTRTRARRAPRRAERDDEDEFDDDEEDEDATPARTSSIQPGWKAANKVLSRNRSFAPEFKFTEDPALVRFASSEPFGSFAQHWVERQGKRSFICLDGIDPKGCPLCKTGDIPRAIVAFNLFVLVEDGDVLDAPVVKALLAGPQMKGQIETKHKGRSGPIDANYWSLAKAPGSKKGAYVPPSIDAVKERDLEEDWDLDPVAVEKAIQKLKPFDASIFKLPTRKELTEIAREITDGD